MKVPGARFTARQLTLLGLLFAVALLDSTRVGFFGDDFLFLDAARRKPVGEVLLGHHGIYPWYRPLSRELYFYAALAAGSAGRAVTIAFSLVTAGAAVLALAHIGRALGSPRVGLAAASLFAAHALTKLLTAWASGYQDLLSIALVLTAVTLELQGRSRLAFAAAFLAPFAKETGAVAVLLVILARSLRTARRPSHETLAAGGLTLGAIALLHAAARATWTGGGNTRAIVADPRGMIEAIAETLQGFASSPAAPTLPAIVLGGAAAVATWHLMRMAPEGRTTTRPLVALGAAGTALGLAPLVVGNLAGLSVTNTYYAFPAVPWLSLLLASAIARLPGRAFRAVLAALVAWNVLALSCRAPNLDRIEGWFPGEPGWTEAVRISAATERFAGDLRAAAKGIPGGTTILYSRLPVGSFFVQGDDGAATREMLGDSSVRAYFIGSAPPRLDRRRLRLVTFDPGTGHLRLEDPVDPNLLAGAIQRLAMGDAAVATLLSAHARPPEERFRALRRYIMASANLDPAGRGALIDEGGITLWPDSTSPEVTRFARELLPAPDSTLLQAYETALRRPLTAGVHQALAESLLLRGHALPAALALRGAIALDGGSGTDHLVLGGILEETGMRDRAKGEYRRAIRLGRPAWIVPQARSALEELERRDDSRQPRGDRW